VRSCLCALLAHPDIASKHWIIRQYDHEVQGGSTVKPLAGPGHDGPTDAAVIRPKLGSARAIAISNGLATPLGDVDPYWMALAAIDEAVRNAVCVGADPGRIAVLDNFCWPSCDEPGNLGSLVRAAEACRDGALAYRTPFISGKDSLNNQFTTDAGETIAIPPTLLISAIGHVHDAGLCLTSDAKRAGNLLLQVGATTPHLGASYYHAVTGAPPSIDIPRVDLEQGPRTARVVADLISEGVIASAHDCSEGGLVVAAAEMAFAGRLGLAVDLAGVPVRGAVDDAAACFAETPSRYLLEVAGDQFDAVARRLRDAGIPFGEVGAFNETDRLTVTSAQAGQLADVTIDTLLEAWRRPLDW
jgi:phosphoribosylformylglycinamidine synthase